MQSRTRICKRAEATYHSALPISLIFLGLGCIEARADVIDFETLTDGEVVTSQFAGLTFSNAVALKAGVSLNEFEFPPRSGSTVISDSGGPITIRFAVPVSFVSGYFTYLTQLTLTAFDGANNQVGQAVSFYSNNMALSGDPGSSANELLHVAFASEISRVRVAGDPFGGSFVMDDAKFEAQVATPEASPSALLFVGVIGIMLLRKRES